MLRHGAPQENQIRPIRARDFQISRLVWPGVLRLRSTRNRQRRLRQSIRRRARSPALKSQTLPYYRPRRRHLLATGRTLTLSMDVELLKRVGSHPEMDENRRVKIKHPLGQYLIDGARLFEGMAAYRDSRLPERSLCRDPPLHPRRTLDQAYYWTLDTSRTRDKDQVIYRATTPEFGAFHCVDPDKGWSGHENVDAEGVCRDCRQNTRKVSRVVMVDQLWMWILDKQTIITCFPKRYVMPWHIYLNKIRLLKPD